MSYMFSDCDNITNITFSSKFDTSRVTTMEAMFRHDKKLQSLDLRYFNTRNVQNMQLMFYWCSSITQIRVGTNWVVSSNNTNMYYPTSVESKITRV